MKKIATLCVIACLLAACGGGGSSLVPNAPSKTGSTQTRTISVTIQVPPKSAQVHAKQRLRIAPRGFGAPIAPARDDVSPSTQGIGFTLAAAGTAFNPYTASLTQNAAFSLSGCPASDCATNTDGSQTYTFSVTLPAGTGELIVTLWDQPPSSSTTFPAGANILADQIVSSAQLGGTPSQTLTLTLYGVPATVAIVPLGGQSHVLPDAGGTAIVGSGCAYYVSTPLDADGNPIVGDATDPSFASYTPARGLVACSGSPSTAAGVVGVRMNYASASPATLAVTYDLNAASGISNITDTVDVQSIQELWVPAWGAGPNGLFGFALDPANNDQPTSTSPFEFISYQYNQTQANAVDSFGYQWVFDPNSTESTSGLTGYYPAQGSQAPASILSTPLLNGTSISINSMGADASGGVWIAETASVTYPAGALLTYSVANGSGYPPSATIGSPVTLATAAVPGSLGGVPPGAPVPSTVSNAVFLAPAGGGLDTCVLASGAITCTAVPGQSSNTYQSVAVDGEGRLWAWDGSTLHVFSMTASGSTVALTQIAQSALTVSGASQMAATATGEVWMVNQDGTPAQGIDEFYLSGSAIAAGAYIPGSAVNGNGAYAISVAP